MLEPASSGVNNDFLSSLKIIQPIQFFLENLKMSNFEPK